MACACDQRLGAVELGVREARIGLGGGEIGFGLRDRRLIGARIDDEEDVAGLDLWPSLKRISVMRPPTSGRISAESTAVMRPENSDHRRTGLASTAATVTGTAAFAAGPGLAWRWRDAASGRPRPCPARSVQPEYCAFSKGYGGSRGPGKLAGLKQFGDMGHRSASYFCIERYRYRGWTNRVKHIMYHSIQ